VPAPVVDRVGVASLQGLTSTASEAPNVNVAPSAVHVAVLDNEQALGRFLESRQGQQIIVDTVRRRKFDIG